MTTALVLAASAVGMNAQSRSDDSSSVVRVSVLPARQSVAPGDVVPVAVILDHDRRWHTQAGGPDADPESIPTSVIVSTTDERLHVRTDAIQWPVAERKPLRWAGPGAEVAVYGGRATIFVPIEIRPDAQTGAASFTVTVGYQACDDRVCLEPVLGRSFPLQFAVTDIARDGISRPGFSNPEFFTDWRPVAPQLEPVVGRGVGIPAWVHATGVVMVLAAVAAALGGTICAGMLGAGPVLLLRLAAGGLLIAAAGLWIGFAVG